MNLNLRIKKIYALLLAVLFTASVGFGCVGRKPAAVSPTADTAALLTEPAADETAELIPVTPVGTALPSAAILTEEAEPTPGESPCMPSTPKPAETAQPSATAAQTAPPTAAPTDTPAAAPTQKPTAAQIVKNIFFIGTCP